MLFAKLVPYVVDIDKSSNIFGENYKYNLCLVVNCPKQRNTGKEKKVMNMEASVTIKSCGTPIDWHELDNTLYGRVQALIHARDMIGFANTLEGASLEVTLNLEDIPLADVRDLTDVDQLQGLDNMTAVDYNDAFRKAHDKLVEAVGNNSELLKAIEDCPLGQLFLIVKEIKDTIDEAADKKY